MARANKSSASHGKTAKRKTRSSKASVECPTGYCVRCRKMQQMNNCKSAKSSNGRNMIKGRCTSCDTKMNKFV